MRNRQRAFAILLAVGFLLISGAWKSPAAYDDRTAADIAYLLDAIRHAPCEFLRNGDAYDGNEAADHIADKYDHYRADIHSADDFIELVASRSSMSGRPYEVQCPGESRVTASTWLNGKLQQRRNP